MLLNIHRIKEILLIAIMLFYAIIPFIALSNESEQAKIEFEKGVECFLAKEYKSALLSFKNSYQIKKKPIVLFNIAMCQKALGDYVASTNSFEQLLLEKGKDLDAETRRKVSQAMDDLAHKVGRLHVDVPLHDAELFLDGRGVTTTPLDAPVTVNPGEHVVTVVKQGYQTWSREVEIDSGTDLEVSVQLQPVPEVATDLLPRDDRAAEATPKMVLSEEVVDTRLSWLTIGGITASVLGVGAGAVGVYFSVKREKDVNRGTELNEEMGQTSNSDEYNLLEAQFDAIDDEEFPMHKTGEIVSYVLAGALLTTGTVLILVDNLGKKRKKEVSVTPLVGGVDVRF